MQHWLTMYIRLREENGYDFGFATYNNANIITLGAQVTGIELAKCLVKEYLSVTFDPESRSMPKVARITEYEKEGK